MLGENASTFFNFLHFFENSFENAGDARHNPAHAGAVLTCNKPGFTSMENKEIGVASLLAKRQIPHFSIP